MNEQEARKKFGIPANANLTIVDMDDNPDKYERKTGGWTDEQIKNKPLEDIEALLENSQKVEDILRKNLEEQTNRTLSYSLIRDRKIILNNT